jgi:serine/threonine protein kinase
MLNAGTILQNRYRVVRPLGRGGMGAVYEAFDERLSRSVALKETLAETDELRRAFEREARLLANLRHSALPKVLDHFSEGDGLFLLMEFIPGDDLGRMLEEQGHAFPTPEVLEWADQLLNALEYLHTLNPRVLHRDIKPSNLKLITRHQIVLLDFGLAKGSAGQMAHTQSRSLLAYSPNYSPLEQMQGAGTDERSDLYALGATLYHLLTGVKPTDALTRANMIVNGQLDPLQAADKLNGEIPAAVSAALMRAMALNIDNRPRTAAEMRDDLHNRGPRAASTVPMTGVDEEATRISLPAPRAGVAGQSAAGKRQVIVPLPEETWVARKRGGGRWKWLAGLSLAAILAALGVTLYFLSSGNVRPERAQTNRPATRSTPRPSPTQTPEANVNLSENINSPTENINGQPAPGEEEKAARETLAGKNIPYTEEAFSSVVEEGDPESVELFLKAGMTPNAKDGAGRPVLVRAASAGSDEISRRLLKRGADVNARDGQGTTALMEAAQNDHRETASVLLENNAALDLTDNNGRTALLLAAARGHSRLVRLLINKGARIEIKDKDGRDALMWAEINNQSDVVELLKKAGASSR